MSHTDYVSLLGSFRSPLPGAEIIHFPLDDTIEITIRLKSANADGYSTVETTGSLRPKERTYLAREQYERLLGPSGLARRTLENFLSSHNLTLLAYEAGGRSVRASGSRPSIEEAFQTQLHMYRYLEHGVEKIYRGRAGYVQLPSELAAAVEGVFGLDNRPQATPFVRLRVLPDVDGRRLPNLPIDFYQGITSFYRFPGSFFAGEQCIGVIEFGGGFYQADANNFFSQCNVSSRPVNVVAVGADNKTNFGDSRDLEVALDIELAGVFAPNATIVAYFAPPTEKGWVDAIGNAVHDSIYHPSCLSISWGYTEASGQWTGDCILAVNSIFQDAALFGITVCAASGDAGPEFQGNLAQVNFPASSPFVLSCGGTMLNSGWPPTSETVWHESDAASGGGISDLIHIPRWQSIVRSPSVVLPRAVPQFRGRMLPDVAALANGYPVLFNNNKWADASGTSAAAPLWAALIVRINGILRDRGVSLTVGYLNPLLYQSLQQHGVCRDILSGDNAVNGGAGYSAGEGWDACTGWGTPIGESLLQSLI